MITAFFTFLGILSADYQKRKIACADDLIYIGNQILLMLSSTAPETDKIFDRLKRAERLKDFDFSNPCEGFPLSREEIETAREFLNSVGKYDTDTQIGCAKEFIGYFQNVKKQYRQYYDSHAKIYYALGISAGAVAAVLLI